MGGGVERVVGRGVEEAVELGGGVAEKDDDDDG